MSRERIHFVLVRGAQLALLAALLLSAAPALAAAGRPKGLYPEAVREVLDMKARGRSVLIGTRLVDKSEELSRRLTAAGVETPNRAADRRASTTACRFMH